MTDKEAFHFAKLMLFNTRLLSDLQKARGSDTAEGRAMEEIVQKRARLDDLTMGQGDSLIHQSTFLAMAYVTLVWLTERFNRDDISCRIEKMGGFDEFSADGPRAQNHRLSSREYLRLIRNAISHAEVDVNDTQFVFTDGRSDKGPTCVRISWEQLGKLTEDALSSVNDLLYPDARSERT
jgi:hypothetical protein